MRSHTTLFLLVSIQVISEAHAMADLYGRVDFTGSYKRRGFKSDVGLVCASRLYSWASVVTPSVHCSRTPRACLQ